MQNRIIYNLFSFFLVFYCISCTTLSEAEKNERKILREYGKEIEDASTQFRNSYLNSEYVI